MDGSAPPPPPAAAARPPKAKGAWQSKAKGKAAQSKAAELQAECPRCNVCFRQGLTGIQRGNWFRCLPCHAADTRLGAVAAQAGREALEKLALLKKEKEMYRLEAPRSGARVGEVRVFRILHFRA